MIFILFLFYVTISLFIYIYVLIIVFECIHYIYIWMYVLNTNWPFFVHPCLSIRVFPSCIYSVVFKISPNVGNNQIISLPFLVRLSFFGFLSYFYVGLYMSVAPNTIWYYVSWIKLEFNNKQVILYPLKKPCIIFLHFYVNLYPSITPNTRLYYVYYGCVSL